MPSGAAVTVYEGKHGRTFRVKYRDVSGRGRPRRARVRRGRGRGGLCREGLARAGACRLPDRAVRGPSSRRDPRNTVRKHLENIYAKLGVSNRAGAVGVLLGELSRNQPKPRLSTVEKSR